MRATVFSIFAALSVAGCAGSQAQDAETQNSEPDELGETIALRSVDECRFDPLTEHGFEGLLLMGWEPQEVLHAPQIAIGDAAYTPVFTDTEMEGTGFEDIPNGREYRSQVDLPGGSTWHGLPLENMFVEFFAPPETDSLYRRGLRFGASADEVRRTLSGIGHDIPVRPDFRALDEYSAFASRSCGGAILIEPDGAGSMLVCERGC